MTAKLVPFERFNVADLEAGLAAVAEAIAKAKDSGVPPQALIVCLGYADGCTQLFSFGTRSSALETDGWLARALRRGGITVDGQRIEVQPDSPA